MSDDFAQWLAQNPEPSLAELIRQYGGYNMIPPEAWVEFDAAMAAWQSRRGDRFGGAISIPNHVRKFKQRRAVS